MLGQVDAIADGDRVDLLLLRRLALLHRDHDARLVDPTGQRLEVLWHDEPRVHARAALAGHPNSCSCPTAI